MQDLFRNKTCHLSVSSTVTGVFNFQRDRVGAPSLGLWVQHASGKSAQDGSEQITKAGMQMLKPGAMGWRQAEQNWQVCSRKVVPGGGATVAGGK